MLYCVNSIFLDVLSVCDAHLDVLILNPCGAEGGIFWKNTNINTMAADALARWVARSSAAMVLTV